MTLFLAWCFLAGAITTAMVVNTELDKYNEISYSEILITFLLACIVSWLFLPLRVLSDFKIKRKQNEKTH
jgi:hypothetical protein